MEVGDDGAESELGMTVVVLIRFPIGVGNDNGGVINGLWEDRRGMSFYGILF